MADDEPREMLGYPAFGFADPGPLREELTASVLAGTKVGTSSLVADYILDQGPLPSVGDLNVVYDSQHRPVCIVEITRWQLSTIGTVDDEFAWAEGEGFADAAAWRKAHIRFWNGYIAEYREGLRDPDFELTHSTPVVCEWFLLVARVDWHTREIQWIEEARKPDEPSLSLEQSM
jgi:uncharacterized protein YhfF